MLYHSPHVKTQFHGDGTVRPLLSLGIVLLPGFSLLSLSCFVETLRHSAEVSDLKCRACCAWVVMGESMTPIAASSGVSVSPGELFGEPRRFDYMAVIGGTGVIPHSGGAAVFDYLQRCAAYGLCLVGVGSGVAALQAAGLMHSRRFCVHWATFSHFSDAHQSELAVGDQLFLADGNRITCAGESAAADLALWLVENRCGPAVAQVARHQMLMGNSRSATAAQPHPACNDDVQHDRVRKAILLMRRNLKEPVSVTNIARRVNVSKRQLERLFVKHTGLSIQHFCRALRLRHGLWSLIHTPSSVTVIAQECGFSDSSHFSRLFSQAFGATPSRLRLDPERAKATYERAGSRPTTAPGRSGLVCVPGATALGEEQTSQAQGLKSTNASASDSAASTNTHQHVGVA